MRKLISFLDSFVVLFASCFALPGESLDFVWRVGRYKNKWLFAGTKMESTRALDIQRRPRRTIDTLLTPRVMKLYPN